MKRLIYGVSVVALMLTASFSFVSCDDYVQDQFTEIKKNLTDKSATIDGLRSDLARVESEYKAAIAAQDAALKQKIDAQDGMLLATILGLGQGVSDTLSYYSTTEEMMECFEKFGEEIAKQIDDTLAYYVTSENLTEILKAYVTRQELIDSLESVTRLAQALAKVNSDNIEAVAAEVLALTGRVNADSARIDAVAAGLLALTDRVDTNSDSIQIVYDLYLGLKNRVEVLEAAVKTNLDGSITLSTEMEKAVNEAVKAQIDAKAAALTIGYKQYADSVSKEKYDSAIVVVNQKYEDGKKYTDEKYQAALDSVNKKYQSAINYSDEKYQAALDSVNKKYQSAINYTDEKYQASLDSLNAKYQSAINYTDEKYQAALDSVKALATKAEQVHAEIVEMVETLRNATVESIVALEDKVAGLREDYEAFALLCRESINLLQNQIDDLNAQVDDLNAWRVGVNESISQINEVIDKIKDNYKSQITSIVLQGTYNNVFGSINLPFDIQSMLVAGHYGRMVKSVSFPSSEATLYTGMPFELDAQDTVAEPAGKVYLTINPNTVNIDNVNFKLVNSLDEEIGFKVGPVVPSTDRLSFGWTRANNGFYEAPVSLYDDFPIDEAKPRIDLEDIKYVLKKAYNERNNIDLSSLARIIYENTSDVLDAAAIKATWTDGFGNEQSVYTNYNLAATAIKPLSFEFDGFNQYAKKIANKLNEYTLKTFDPIAFEYEFDLEFDSIAVQPMPNSEFPIIILYKKGAMLKSIDGMAQMSAFIDAMNAYYVASTNNQLNDLINDIEGQVKHNVQDLLNEANSKVNTYVNKVNNYITKFNNYFTKVVNKFGNADYNHYLQPVLLIGDKQNHFGQLSRSNVFPTFVALSEKKGEFKEGSIILTPTTYTSELLAPAMLKYVAVTHIYDYNYDSRVYTEWSKENIYLPIINEGPNMNVVFAGKQQAGFEIPAEECTDKLYEIYYEAVDFSGMTSSDKYYIYVVD